TGQVVKELNGLTDHASLVAGPNITITPNTSNQTLTISSTVASPAQTAYQAFLEFVIPDQVATATIAIPANKRFVIEYITFAVGAESGDLVSFDLTTHIGNGGDVRHEFWPTRVVDNSLWALDHLVRIYAEGSIKFLVSTTTHNGASGGSISLSGY